MSEIVKDDSGLFAVTIEDQVYAFEKYGAEESLDVLIDIVKIVGKPLGAAVAALGASGQDAKQMMIDRDFDPNMLGVVFESLTSSLDKGVVKHLIKKFCSEKVLCDGKKINFNTHYQGRLPLMLKVVQAALEVQYGNFSDVIPDLLPSAPKKAPLSNHPAP